MKLACSIVAALLALPGATFAFGPCYTVYDKRDAVIYRADEPPIDLSRPISAGMAERFPGGHLVMENGTTDCPRVAPGEAQPARANGRRVGRSGDARDAQQRAVVAAPVAAAAPAAPAAEAQPAEASRGRTGGGMRVASHRAAPTDTREPANEVAVASYTRSNGSFVPAHLRSLSRRGRR